METGASRGLHRGYDLQCRIVLFVGILCVECVAIPVLRVEHHAVAPYRTVSELASR